MSKPSSLSNVLMSVFSWGVRCGARAELEDMLQAVRVLYPHSAIGDLCEARMKISAGDWLVASQLLRQIDARGDGNPAVWALQSWCLYSLDDIEWQRVARAVLDSGNETATAIVARFITSQIQADYCSGNPRERVAQALGVAAL